MSHSFDNGICTNCGLSREAVDRFKWSCQGQPRETKEHKQQRPKKEEQRSKPFWLIPLFLISRILQVYAIAGYVSGGIGWLSYLLIFVIGGQMLLMQITGWVFPVALIVGLLSSAPWWWWIVVIVGECEMITRYTNLKKRKGLSL